MRRALLAAVVSLAAAGAAAASDRAASACTPMRGSPCCDLIAEWQGIRCSAEQGWRIAIVQNGCSAIIHEMQVSPPVLYGIGTVVGNKLTVASQGVTGEFDPCTAVLSFDNGCAWIRSSPAPPPQPCITPAPHGTPAPPTPAPPTPAPPTPVPADEHGCKVDKHPDECTSCASCKGSLKYCEQQCADWCGIASVTGATGCFERLEHCTGVNGQDSYLPCQVAGIIHWDSDSRGYACTYGRPQDCKCCDLDPFDPKDQKCSRLPWQCRAPFAHTPGMIYHTLVANTRGTETTATALKTDCQLHCGTDCDNFCYLCAATSTSSTHCGTGLLAGVDYSKVKQLVDAQLHAGHQVVMTLAQYLSTTTGNKWFASGYHDEMLVGFSKSGNYLIHDPEAGRDGKSDTFEVVADQLFNNGEPKGWEQWNNQPSGGHCDHSVDEEDCFYPMWFTGKFGSDECSGYGSGVRRTQQRQLDGPSQIREVHIVATFACAGNGSAPGCGCGDAPIHNATIVGGVCGQDAFGYSVSRWNGSHVASCFNCTDAACSQNCHCDSVLADTCSTPTGANGTVPLVRRIATRRNVTL